MVPRLCQFYTCSDIAEILWCPDYVNLQRFFRDSMVPRLCQFTEISMCPDYVNLQRFYRDFNVPRLCQQQLYLFIYLFIYLPLNLTEIKLT